MTMEIDRAPHEQLLLKIKYYGLADPSWSSSTSYHADRYQVASNNGTLSHSQPITDGIMQKRVIWSILFLF